MTKAEANEAQKTAIENSILHGACGTCQRDARKCLDEKSKFKCAGWLRDEVKITEIVRA